MKAKLTVLALSVMLLGGVPVWQAHAGTEAALPPGCGAPPPEFLLGGLERALGLSEQQKAEIEAIFAQEKDHALTPHQKEIELRRQLRQAEQAATFDEEAVRSAATALAAQETELMVSRAKVHHRISSVLTAAQRAQADQLLPAPDGRPGPPCGLPPDGAEMAWPARKP